MSNAEEFWSWFAANEAEYRVENIDEREDLHAEFRDRLGQYDEELFWEIGHDPEGLWEVVISAAGNPEKADAVRKLVEAAPAIEGWRFTAFKQPLGLDFQVELDGLVFDPNKMWFVPLQSEEFPEAIAIRIGIRGFSEDKEDEFLRGAYIVLDTVLGEERVMDTLDYVEVGPLPNALEEEGYIELSDLDYYLTWLEEGGRTDSN
ncbi:MAG: hypothetical protein ACYS8Z_07480 [Planctomycetota bacterium]